MFAWMRNIYQKHWEAVWVSVIITLVAVIYIYGSHPWWWGRP